MNERPITPESTVDDVSVMPHWFPSEIQEGCVLVENKMDLNGVSYEAILSLGDVSNARQTLKLPLCVSLKDLEGNESIIRGEVFEGDRGGIQLSFDEDSGLSVQHTAGSIALCNWEEVMRFMIEQKMIGDMLRERTLKQLGE